MTKNWWKILAAILVIYATAFSFFRPLEPGIIETDISDLKVGQNQFTVTGYNTHYKEFEKSFEAFLGTDSSAICVDLMEVIDENHVKLSCYVPEKFPKSVVSLYISNDRTGTTFLPQAFHLNEISIGKYFGECQIEFHSGEELAYEFPFQLRIFETIRNLNFHVPMWFTMFVLMGISLFSSITYLYKGEKIYDLRAADAARIALVFCVFGLITGSIWARFAWGDWWTNDAKLNGAAVSFLLLVAYFILRKSAEDRPNAERIAAVYNIISFFMIMALIMILPRLTGSESLHPGEDGNPAFSQYDLDSNLRMVFYPACAGWIMTGIWIYLIRLRISKIQNKLS